MKQYPIYIIILAGLLCSVASLATASDIRVSAKINQQEIYHGQPFGLTITVENADDVTSPQNITFPNFQTQFAGEDQNSSFIYTNGQSTSTKRINLSYQLTLQNNTTTIPSVTVIADGKPYTTRPIPITIKQPEKNENFKLEVTLSKNTAYVGEPIIMSTTWLIGQKARGGGFDLPVLSDARFKTSPRPDMLPKDKRQLIQVELANETFLARQYSKRVNGREGVAITFYHTLIPQQAGTITLPTGTIAVSALTGHETPRSRNRDPFGRPSRQREVYSTLVIPASPVTLKVIPLPTKNVPSHFNGLVGKYQIQASISPTTMNVGDPITLNLKISGQAANTMAMPPLPLKNFKVSNDPPKRKTTVDTTTFITTIRAENEQIKEIPAIPLSFFDVETGRYETASTNPIPITVRPTHIITANDALGGDGDVNQNVQEPRADVHQGIHYNYSDVQTGSSKSTNTMMLWLSLIVPPAFFILIILLNRNTDSATKTTRKRKQRALKQFKKDLGQSSSPFDTWLNFLGDELGRPPQSITAQDVLPQIAGQPELHAEIKKIFAAGDAVKYGGQQTSIDQQTLIENATLLHKVLK